MFKIIIQLHGGKGSTTTNVQSYQPTEQEIRLQKQAADYSEAVAPNALHLNTVAANLLESSLGDTQVDFDALNNTAQSQIAGSQNIVSNLSQGVLPESYLQNMQTVLNNGVQQSVGNSINNLGNRGILNSTVTNQALSDTSDAAATAMANAYTSNIATLNGLAGQQASLANAPILTAAAAQSAAQQPALDLWQASLGLNTGGTTNALSAISGSGTTTSTRTTSGGSGLFGGILTGLAGNSGLF